MSSPPNVLLLIFDTLRSDHVSCYGDYVHTPAFDSVASTGTVFERAFAGGPATPVSHAALYSGQYPSENGVTGQYIPLRDDIPLIASWLRDAGYDTFGITGPSKMGSDWGYDRGFEDLYEPYYEHPPTTSVKNITKSVTDPRYRDYFVRKLTKGGKDRTRFKFDLLEDKIRSELDCPFFGLANFLTPHVKYDPPRPYKEEFTEGFSRPRLFLTEYLLDKRGVIDDPEVRLDRVIHAQTMDGIGRFLADPSWLNEKEVAVLRQWYRACVKYLDDELDRFLRYYQSELQNDTILILTADHGEQLGEHGLWTHSHYLFDETMKVPLIMTGPGVPSGERCSDFASLIDVFDTICDLCGLEQPSMTSGRSLFSSDKRDAAFMEYGARDPDEFKHNSGHGRYLDDAQLEQFCAGRKGIRTEDYLFVITSNGTEHLYENPDQHEVNDPPENVTRELRERIHETLPGEFGVWPEGDPDEVGLDQKVKENLRRLGYID
jgi:arylsulfatase A-like enzyme